jgi:hypothetical protein
MARHMREADAREVWYQAAMKPEDALLLSLRDSEVSMTAHIKGKESPLLMFGLGMMRGFFDRKQSIWLLGTERIDDIPVTFLRQSFAQMQRICAGKRVYNYVHAENEKSLRWLKALGFTIMEAEPYGWLNKPFHYVEKDMRDVWSS